MTVRIKDLYVLAGLMSNVFDPKLIAVVTWIGNQPWGRANIFITESFRKALRPGDVHATDPVRAIDLRSWLFEDPETIALMINRNWLYDPNRPHMKVAVYHKTKTGAWHFHLQVHPNTQRRH